MMKKLCSKKALAVFALILVAAVVFTALTVYRVAKKDFDEEMRRLRLAQSEELSSLEEALSAKTFDLDPLLALDRLYASNSLSDADKDALTERLLASYASSTGDKYAIYMSADDYTAYLERQNSRFVGIGVSVSNEMTQTKFGHGLTLLTVHKDSPASEGGLRAGDILLSADGVSFDGKTEDEAVALVRGEEGSRVTLTYLRENALATATLSRRAVTEDTVRYEMLSGDVAYILINRFSTVTPHQLSEAVSDCMANGARAFLFDVRNNPGGLVTSVAECLGYLLPDGDIIHVKYGKKPDNNYSYRTQDGKLLRRTASSEDALSVSLDISHAISCPIAVLTNENTASAGEIFAAAMRDYAEKEMLDARLFGEKTFGKGTVQATYRVDGGAAFKMTVATYLPPYGESYDGIGLTPDQPVSLPEQYREKPLDLIPKNEDTQLRAALDYLRAR